MFESGFGRNSQIWCRFGGIMCDKLGGLPGHLLQRRFRSVGEVLKAPDLDCKARRQRTLIAGFFDNSRSRIIALESLYVPRLDIPGIPLGAPGTFAFVTSLR